jgi:hypothetical protein
MLTWDADWPEALRHVNRQGLGGYRGAVPRWDVPQNLGPLHKDAPLAQLELGKSAIVAYGALTVILLLCSTCMVLEHPPEEKLVGYHANPTSVIGPVT